MQQRSGLCAWLLGIAVGAAVMSATWASEPAAGPATAKPGADKVLKILKSGNERFSSGKAAHPHTDPRRLALAGREDQAKYALATVISCSDSRVPVELIFDAGVMDLFVVRVAGNVCDTDEVGSIEYGLAHVRTPLLVVLGHTKCGAVKAVTRALHGESEPLEENIPPLVDNIFPAVKRAMEAHKDAEGDEVVPYAIEENVWQSIGDLFARSPATRRLVREGQVEVMGAIYDIGTGKVKWLPTERTAKLLEGYAAAEPAGAKCPQCGGALQAMGWIGLRDADKAIFFHASGGDADAPKSVQVFRCRQCGRLELTAP
jgi:carbonic anhydrase